MKSGIYFTFAVHSNLDQSHFKDSIATLDIGPKNGLKAEPTLFTGDGPSYLGLEGCIGVHLVEREEGAFYTDRTYLLW